ncbi:hypothetical protein KGF56_004664 [Candida oxycetoniae]|uniref:Uncharacterized protein n=1 Tax=Candida oxycetoniae TaxID=497107 RepID=A0AAI9WW17_9ASCO|nr:uncharacterized protein KGF56_004664 [Candida oxycetoniae]KAI3402572.2 hypothetical protein KGF56_004664 [Candida oxycetoniae]
MELIKSLCDIIIDSKKLYKIIEVIPNGIVSSPSAFNLEEDGDILGIGIPKEKYLKIFKNSHDYFYAHFDQLLNLEGLSKANLVDAYYMTLGYLISTNEHHTIIKLHSRIVNILQNYDQDLELISCFLTCRMSRINKSSSLWVLLQRLILKSHQETRPCLDPKYMLRAIKSCDLHFSNYYGNSFLRWYSAIDETGIAKRAEWFDVFVSLCHSKLSDSSLWSSFNFILRIRAGRDIQTPLEELSPSNQNVDRDYHSAANHEIVVAELKWLFDVECKYITPYKLLILLLDSSDQLEQIEQSLHKCKGISQETKDKLSKTVLDHIDDISSRAR